MPEHLWEIEHDYYGPDAKPDYTGDHASWEDYLENGFASPRWDFKPGGMNLLYRWDWWQNGPTEVETLDLFWILPRKSELAKSIITVSRTDEPAIREFLNTHAEYMRTIWSPLL